jgi:hypothetical protein
VHWRSRGAKSVADQFLCSHARSTVSPKIIFAELRDMGYMAADPLLRLSLQPPLSPRALIDGPMNCALRSRAAAYLLSLRLAGR